MATAFRICPTLTAGVRCAQAVLVEDIADRLGRALHGAAGGWVLVVAEPGGDTTQFRVFKRARSPLTRGLDQLQMSCLQWTIQDCTDAHLSGPVCVPVKRVVNHTRFGSYLSTRKSYAARRYINDGLDHTHFLWRVSEENTCSLLC